MAYNSNFPLTLSKYILIQVLKTLNLCYVDVNTVPKFCHAQYFNPFSCQVATQTFFVFEIVVDWQPDDNDV